MISSGPSYLAASTSQYQPVPARATHAKHSSTAPARACPHPWEGRDPPQWSTAEKCWRLCRGRETAFALHEAAQPTAPPIGGTSICIWCQPPLRSAKCFRNLLLLLRAKVCNASELSNRPGMMPLWLPSKPQSLRYDMRLDSARLIKVSVTIFAACVLLSALQVYLM